MLIQLFILAGMTSSNNLHSLTSEEPGRLFPIIIREYDEKWPGFYRTERERIVEALPRHYIEQIDHIGSTAVPGLKSKPTIDILLQVSGGADSDKIISTFSFLGYHYIKQPENPPPHMMFVKGYTNHGFEGQAYHVHVRNKGNWDEIVFRDYLIGHPDMATEYEMLKIKLAHQYRNDRDGYTGAKTGFVERVKGLALQGRLKNL